MLSILQFYAQNGEDGILLNIFRNIGTTNQYYVEVQTGVWTAACSLHFFTLPTPSTFTQFGTQDASECNTRFLREVLGWSGLLMDGGYENPDINLRREFITPVRLLR